MLRTCLAFDAQGYAYGKRAPHSRTRLKTFSRHSFRQNRCWYNIYTHALIYIYICLHCRLGVLSFPREFNTTLKRFDVLRASYLRRVSYRYKPYEHLHTFTYIYTYTYLYMYILSYSSRVPSAVHKYPR